MDNLSIKIKAMLDKGSIGGIKTEIEKLQNLFNKSPIKIKLDIDSAEFKRFASSISSMSESINKSLRINPNTDGLDKLGMKVRVIKDETGKEFEVLEKKTTQWTNQLEGGIQQAVKEVSNFKQEIDEFGNAITTSAGKTREYISQFDIAEKKSQDEYVNSWTAKIKEIEVRNKLQLKVDENTEKKEQTEYVNSWSAKIKEIENRNKLQIKTDDEKEKIEQQEYVNSWTAKIKEVAERNKLQLKVDDKTEAIEQQEYVNSWSAKIRDIENRNKLEIKIDKATEKQEQDEYVRSWTAKIKEIEKRNKLQLKLETFQGRMLGSDGNKGELDILGSKYGSKIDSTKIDHLRNQVKSLTADMPNLDNEMKKIAQSASLLGKEASQSGTVLGRMADNAFKFLRFYLVGQQIVNLTRSIKDGIKHVQELDNALNRIRVITGETQEYVEKLGKSYNALAKELGATTLEVVNGSVAWFRQGKTAQEAQELVKASIVESKLAAIDSAQATEYLTAALNGFKLESKDAMMVVDQMVAVDNVAATSVAELSLALQRASNSASDAGIELSKLLGYVGTVSSVTRKSASSIGESFKTMFARMADIKMGKIDEDGMALSDVESALNRIDIALRASKTTFRDFDDVLDDVAKSWKELDDIERSNVAKAVAGIRQRENFLVLMNNYDKALELEGVALDSNGLALERYEIHLDSVQAKKDRLKATWESFYKSIFNADIMKGLIEGLTSVVEWMEKTNVVIPILAGLIIGVLYVSLSKLKLKLAEINILSGGIPLLIGAIATAITWLGMSTVSANAKIKDFNEESIRSIRIQKEEVESVDKLTKRYDELKEKTELTTDEKEELYKIQVKLAEIYPQTADGMGLENEKITSQIGLIKQLNATKKEGYEEDIKRLAQKGTLEMQSLVSERDSLELERSNKQSELKMYEDFVSNYSGLYQKGMREFDAGGLSESTASQILSIKDNRFDFSGGTLGFFDIVEKEMVRWESAAADVSNLNDKLETNKQLRQQYAEAIIELDKIQNPHKYGNNPNPYSDFYEDHLTPGKSLKGYIPESDKDKDAIEGSKYSPLLTRDALKQLLDVNKISLDYYYDQLLRIEQSQYSGYRDKSYEQLQSLLQSSDEGTATKAKGFVSLFSEIQSVERQISDESIKLATEAAKQAIEDFENSLTPYHDRLYDINFQLSRYKEILQQTPEDKQEAYLNRINILLEQEKNTLHELNETRRKHLATLDPTSEEYIKLSKEINATSLEWWKLDNQQKANLKTIENYYETLEDLRQKDAEQREKDNAKKLEEDKQKADKLIDSYRTYIVEGIEQEIEALNKSKDAAKSAAQTKIDLIQSQIDALQKQNSELKEQEDREKRLNDIAKQREKIANIEQVEQFKDGKWSWVTNPTKVREETERLQEMQEEYNKWDRDLREKKVIADLQNQIKSIQDSLKAEEDGYNGRINQLQTFVKEQNKLWSMQEGQITSYAELVGGLSELEKGTYEDRLSELNTFVSKYNTLTASLIPIPGNASSSSSSSSVQMWNPSTKKLSTVSNAVVDKYKQQGWTTNIPSDADLRKIIPFGSGGYTGDSEGLALLHKKELVLKEDDTRNFLKGMSFLRNIAPAIKNLQLKPMNAATAMGGRPITVQINKLVTPDAYQFIQQIEGMVRLV